MRIQLSILKYATCLKKEYIYIYIYIYIPKHKHKEVAQVVANQRTFHISSPATFLQRL